MTMVKDVEKPIGFAFQLAENSRRQIPPSPPGITFRKIKIGSLGVSIEDLL
jgi:hypothetical protein